MWHTGLICKLEALGVCNPLLNWIRSYLADRRQRVVLKGHSSSWKGIGSGVPQGSVLGPLLFLIYINDLTEDIVSLPLIYADDTALFEVVDDPVLSADRLNGDLEKISVWSNKWLVTMNPSKCRNIVFSLKHNKPFHPVLFLDDKSILKIESHKHLGLTLHCSMSWKTHILRIYEKANKRLNILKSLKFKINRST